MTLSPRQHDRAKAVFLEARELPRERREEFVREACAQDLAVLAEVRSLLAQDTEGTTLLESPDLEGALLRGLGSTKPGHIAERPGQSVGPYRLLEVLGEGGMGVVFLAEQTAPVRRRVALKVIKPGMDSSSVIARFEAERQSLAMMDHPNIAKVFDAGTTGEGRPYFVMEYVRGVPITTHADRQRLPIEDRLLLFIQVCAAIQHAHQKGIIHRDLKPSNVLVAYDSNQSVVKIIDFGVAKAVNQPVVEATMFTRHGHLIGTPEYMSPEQAEMSPQDIDTRADIYTLGVVLYELLSGTLPFDPDSLRSVGLLEIHRVIREVDPPKPSTKLSSFAPGSEHTLEDISKARQLDPRLLPKRLKGELDWIVMKCLEKDRQRRYDTASALADDLRRYLHNEPVLAGPPSAAYKARKFIRRNRASVLATGLVIGALALGLALTSWQWQRAEAARSAAESARDQAKASDARARGIALDLITEFHDDVQHLPGASRARKRLMELGTDYLDQALTRSADDPGLLLDIADGHDKLGDVAGGLRTPNFGDLDAAMAQYDLAHSLRTQVSRSRSHDTRVAIGLAHSSLCEGDILREKEKIPDSVGAYRAGLQMLDGVPAQARQSKSFQIEQALLLVALSNALGRDGNTERSGERFTLLQKADDLTRRLVSEDADAMTLEARARALSNLGQFFIDARQPDTALPHLQESASIREQLFEADPVNGSRRRALAVSTYALGRALVEFGQVAPGMDKLNQSLEHFRFLVEADPTNVDARSRLSQIYEVIGRSTDAAPDRIAAYRKAVEQSRRVVQDVPEAKNQQVLATQQFGLAQSLARAGQYEEGASIAESAFAQQDALFRQTPNPDQLVALVLGAGVCVDILTGMTKASKTEEPHDAPAANGLRSHWTHLRDDLDRTINWINEQESLRSDDKGIAKALDQLKSLRQTCKSALATTSGAT